MSSVNPVTRKRCAVYCRVSTDERLAQSFNSIDAQREAGQAFITSQRAEGWIPVETRRIELPTFALRKIAVVIFTVVFIEGF